MTHNQMICGKFMCVLLVMMLLCRRAMGFAHGYEYYAPSGLVERITFLFHPYRGLHPRLLANALSGLIHIVHGCSFYFCNIHHRLLFVCILAVSFSHHHIIKLSNYHIRILLLVFGLFHFRAWTGVLGRTLPIQLTNYLRARQ